jgi:mycothiol synthase
MGTPDATGISRLLERARAARRHRPLSEEQWSALTNPARQQEGFAAVLAWEGGRPVGYAQASRDLSAWSAGLVLDPSVSDPPLGRELLDALAEEVGAQGGGLLRLWAPRASGDDDSLAATAGLRRERDLLNMRCRLPLEGAGSTVSVRHFRPGEDEERWIRANNRAFGGHPEQGGWDPATLEQREREPWFDAEGFLLHEEGGRLAAFCWTKIDPGEEPGAGEIYVIGVDPDFQGRGLGREMTLAGLDWLASRGMSAGTLYVDSANRRAVSMYEGLGFSVDHIDRAYTTDLSARDRGSRDDRARAGGP